MSITLLGNKQGKPFYNDEMPVALGKAQEYAKKTGYIASMPDLIGGKNISDFSDGVWNDWFTPMTEENTGKTPAGNEVVLIIHGGGILKTPKRINKAYNDGLISGRARYSTDEWKNALEGKMPDGSEIAIYPLAEFLKKDISEMSKKYGIILDKKEAIVLESGLHSLSDLRENGLYAARCGSLGISNGFIDKLAEKWLKTGNFHSLSNINYSHPGGLLLVVGSNDFCDHIGIGGYYVLGSDARFVGVRDKVAEGDCAKPSKIKDFRGPETQAFLGKTAEIIAVQEPKAKKCIEVYTPAQISEVLKGLDLENLVLNALRKQNIK